MHEALGCSASGLPSEHNFPTIDDKEGHELCAADIEASNSYHPYFTSHLAERLPDIELFSVDVPLLDMPDSPGVASSARPATQWGRGRAESEHESFQHESECLSSTPSQSISTPSSFEYQPQRPRILNFDIDTAADATDYLDPDSPYNDPLSSDPLEFSISLTPEHLDELSGDDVLADSPPKAPRPIPRHPAALGPTRRPNPPRQSCTLGKCKSTFTRPSDLVRHQQDIHERGNIIYKCKGCKHGKFGRRDKMLEHCRSQEHGGFYVVEVASNPGAASALHSSCRRKKANPARCEE